MFGAARATGNGERFVRVACFALLLESTIYPTTNPAIAIFKSEQTAVRLTIENGPYDIAEARAAAFYSTSRSAFGDKSLEAAAAGDLLVEARVRSEHGASPTTRALAELILKRKESLVGTVHLALVPSVRNLGDALMNTSDYELAVHQYERALELLERAQPNRPEEVADSLESLGYALTKTERYDAAGTVLDRALLLADPTGRSAKAHVAWILERKAFLLLQRGQYAAARPLVERAQAIATAAAPALPETARVLDTLGNLCWFEGDLASAERYYRRAITVAEPILGSEHPTLATYLVDLAHTRSMGGFLVEAQSLQERALTIGKKSLGPTHFELASQLTALANTKMMRGDYIEARTLYEQALNKLVARFGPDHLHVATLAHNMALLQAYLGDFAEAQQQQERAITIWQHALGSNHPYVARALDALAGVYSEQSRYGEARSLYERALKIREQSLQPAHRELAETLTNLARTVAQIGDVRRATDLSRRALRAWEQNGRVDDPMYAQALLVHGQLSLLSREPALAQRQYALALSQLQQQVGDTHPDVAIARTGLASALLARKQYKAALTEALTAEATGRTHLLLTSHYLAERQALLYSEHRTRALDVALSVLVRIPASKSDINRTFDAVIRSKALVLDEMAMRQRVATQVAGPDLVRLQSALAAARQRLANLVVRGPDPDRPDTYRSILNDALRERDQAERAVAERSVTFRRDLGRMRMGFPDVRAALPAQAALVSFVRYSDTFAMDGLAPRHVASYVAFVLRNGDDHPVLVPLGPASVLDGCIVRWRHEMSVHAAMRRPSNADAAYRRVGVALRRSVWDPIAPQLSRVRYAFLVPDGPLNLVSFAALPLRDGGYLVEEMPAIHYLSAERDLVSSYDHVGKTPALLAVGDPEFDLAAVGGIPSVSRGPKVKPGQSANAVNVGLDSPCPSVPDLRFEPLPAARREAEEIADIWRKRASRDSAPPRAAVLLGEDADESAVKRLAPGNRILHFATHGFFLGAGCQTGVAGSRGVGGLSTLDVAAGVSRWDEDPLLQSGLALAGANRRAKSGHQEEDGILTAEEVSALALEGTEWAVLSACDTGVGAIAAGEGVLGLRRAFQVAGVRTVIMSLWAVDDEAARRWMHALYDGWLRQHLSTVDAVRRASLLLLRDRRSTGRSTHPFFWAGFVAAGNWRSSDTGKSTPGDQP